MKYREPKKNFTTPKHLDSLKAEVASLEANYAKNGFARTAEHIEQLSTCFRPASRMTTHEASLLFKIWAFGSIAQADESHSRWKCIKAGQQASLEWLQSGYDRSEGTAGRLFELHVAIETHRYRESWGGHDEPDSACVRLVSERTGNAYKAVSVEVKSNGGNCGNIVNSETRPKLVIYRASAKGFRTVEKVVTAERFVREMEAVNLFNQSKDELPIQFSARTSAVYKVVTKWADWDANHEYTIEELEG